MRFSVQGTVRSAIDALDFAISDMALVPSGGGFTVLASSGPNGGLASYALNATGAATLIDTAMFNPNWALGISVDLAVIDDGWGGVNAVFGMTGATQIGAYSVGADGAIGSVVHLTGLPSSIGHCNTLAETADNDLLIAGTGTGFSVFTPSANTLTAAGNVEDTAESLAESVSILAQLDIGANTVVLAGSDTEAGISSYLRAGSTLTLADVSGPDQGLGLMVPTDIATTKIAGTDYAIIATAQDNNGALSVFQVAADGTLTPTDHVLDTRDTRFGGVQSIEVIEHNGISFVVAGGSDDGLSLFALMSDGKLQLLDTIVDTAAIGLTNVSAIVGASFDDNIRLLIGSQSEGRLTDLSIDLSDLGNQLRAAPAGNSLTGSGGDDFLIGLEGDDTLSGGQGDDTLVDGAGSDSLTGGAGWDVFVLRDDGAADTITDFNPTYDRLDLSSWPMFHDPGSLTITATSTGATITWREETLHVFSANGQPLSPDELRQTVIEGINRPMDISGIEFPDNGEYDFIDTDGDDLLRAGAGDQSIALGYGDDTVYAGAGNDVIVNGQGINRIFLEDGDDTFSDQNTSTASDGDIVYGGGGNDNVSTGIGADQVFGGSGNDTIHTDGGSDYVDGGSGADMVWLGGGDDQFEEEDTESAGEADEVYGGTGDDTLKGGGGDDSLDGEAGNDLLNGGTGDDTLRGGIGDDVLNGNVGDDRLEGGDGADELHGGSHNDMLFGDNGQDTLDGGTGDDTMDGGGGNDTLTGGDGHDTLTGAQGDDHLNGGSGRDTLRGGDGADTLNGGGWSDTLFGDAGDDELIGDSGDDVLSGGAGNDHLDGGTGRDTLNGGDGNDRLDGGLWADTLFGDAGDDELIGNNGNDELHGGLGNDVISGGEGADTIFGDEGNDTITGGDETDTIDAGAGNDTLNGGTGNDTLHGGAGNDQITAGAGVDRLFGDDGNDTLYATSGDGNTLDGGAGNDALHGGSGTDTLTGGDGLDELRGYAGNDRLEGGAGADTLLGNGGKDRLYGDGGDDRLFGGGRKDWLFGGDDNDLLNGGGGRDVLVGGSGDDVLIGGRRNDRLTGGTGDDEFLFTRRSGHDRIKDFDPSDDTLHLKGIKRAQVDFYDTGKGLVVDWGRGSVLLLKLDHHDFHMSDILFG